MNESQHNCLFVFIPIDGLERRKSPPNNNWLQEFNKFWYMDVLSLKWMNPLDDFFGFFVHIVALDRWNHHVIIDYKYLVMFGAFMKSSFGWVNHGMIPLVFHPHCWAWNEKTPPYLQVLVFFLHMYVFFIGWMHHRKIPFFHPHCRASNEKIVTSNLIGRY